MCEDASDSEDMEYTGKKEEGKRDAGSMGRGRLINYVIFGYGPPW
jgi:hypothetical protein